MYFRNRNKLGNYMLFLLLYNSINLIRTLTFFIADLVLHIFSATINVGSVRLLLNIKSIYRVTYQSISNNSSVLFKMISKYLFLSNLKRVLLIE